MMRTMRSLLTPPAPGLPSHATDRPRTDARRGGLAWSTGVVLAAACLLLSACGSLPAGDGPQGLADLKTQSDQTESERRARVRLELAAAYFAEGKSAVALDEVKQAIAADPKLPEAYNLRGLIYAAMAEPRLAEDSFRQALQLSPRDGAVMHNHAWFLCQASRHEEAQALFQRALAEPRYTGRVRTLLAQGVCLVRAGRLEPAQRVLAQAYELDPSNPFTGFHLGEVLFLQGDHERAAFYLRRLHAQPETASPRSLWLAARNAHRLGNAVEARMWGQRLRDRFPQAPETLLFEKGRFDG